MIDMGEPILAIGLGINVEYMTMVRHRLTEEGDDWDNYIYSTPISIQHHTYIVGAFYNCLTRSGKKTWVLEECRTLDLTGKNVTDLITVSPYLYQETWIEWKWYNFFHRLRGHTLKEYSIYDPIQDVWVRKNYFVYNRRGERIYVLEA